MPDVTGDVLWPQPQWFNDFALAALPIVIAIILMAIFMKAVYRIAKGK